MAARHAHREGLAVQCAACINAQTCKAGCCCSALQLRSLQDLIAACPLAQCVKPPSGSASDQPCAAGWLGLH